MGARPRSWWQQIRKRPTASLLIALLIVVIVLSVLSVLGYIFNWDWVGLGPYISSPHPNGSNFQRGKTLWDWLQLLVIPLMLAIGGFWLNQLQKSREEKTTKQRYEQDRQIALDKQREDILQAYLDRMSELLLEKQLGTSASEDVRNVARVRTVTVLTQLDGRRASYVFAFLREARLMSATSNDNVVSLKNADLHTINWSQADLSGADLREANLREVNLSRAALIKANLSDANLFFANLYLAEVSEANLSGAALWSANLSGANLSGANFSGASLIRANLSGANLSGANLSDAGLTVANLSGANLSRASLIRANLKDATGITTDELEKQAKSLTGATMPDGTKHD